VSDAIQLDGVPCGWATTTSTSRIAATDTIDCGDGIDDPEPDPLDTFIGCENI
jgi:hypothetical protein